MEYSEIKEKLDIASKRWDEFQTKVDESWDFNRSYGEYFDKVYGSPEYIEYRMYEEMERLNRPTYNLRAPKEWEKELRMTVEEFLSGCKCGLFTDYDGSGYYGTEDQISDIDVYPSSILKKKRNDFTHIWWYNK